MLKKFSLEKKNMKILTQNYPNFGGGGSLTYIRSNMEDNILPKKTIFQTPELKRGKNHSIFLEGGGGGLYLTSPHTSGWIRKCFFILDAYTFLKDSNFREGKYH